jgi:hypothetical protein
LKNFVTILHRTSLEFIFVYTTGDIVPYRYITVSFPRFAILKMEWTVLFWRAYFAAKLNTYILTEAKTTCSLSRGKCQSLPCSVQSIISSRALRGTGVDSSRSSLQSINQTTERQTFHLNSAYYLQKMYIQLQDAKQDSNFAWYCHQSFKEIVSWDFDGILMILSHSLDVRRVPLHVLFLILTFSYSNFIIYDFFTLIPYRVP